MPPIEPRVTGKVAIKQVAGEEVVVMQEDFRESPQCPARQIRAV